MRPWEQAWDEALYGERGFYRSIEGPAGHFATSCHGAVGAAFAEAVVALARREGLRTIVDVGAGRGELLGRVAALVTKPGWRFVGVDVVGQPDGLSDGVEWRIARGGGAAPALRDLGPALVVANEWLDVVPCGIAQVDGSGEPREVLVDGSGRESLGGALEPADRAWVDRWWPVAGGVEGGRLEVGRARDEALESLLAQVDSGLVVAIDYGHLAGGRPDGGSLTGYRAGRQVAPVPDGSGDITAHVAMDSLPHDRLVRQRDALGELGIRGERAADDLAVRDPAGYLAALQRNSAVSELCGPGLGDFWWAVTRLG